MTNNTPTPAPSLEQCIRWLEAVRDVRCDGDMRETGLANAILARLRATPVAAGDGGERVNDERLAGLIADAQTEYNTAASGNDFEAGGFWGPLLDVLRDYRYLRSSAPSAEVGKAWCKCAIAPFDHVRSVVCTPTEAAQPGQDACPVCEAAAEVEAMGYGPPKDIEGKIRHALNSISRENESHTPDFILSNYLLSCLQSFEAATRTRDGWHGFKPWGRDTYGSPTGEPVAAIDAAMTAGKGEKI
jgi:hypothetical protein